MTPQRWKQVREVFDQALDLAPEERSGFLVSATQGDCELLDEVKSLLQSAERDGTSLDRTAFREEPKSELAVSVAGYRIASQLGEGGAARVFEAVAPDGVEVALKILRREGGLEEHSRRRFLREARLARQLRHPNIVRVLDVIDDGNVSAIVMELVRGKPLSSLIRAGGMNLDSAVGTALEICEALGAAHARAIVHRDLKPGNVMIDELGSARILDFGAAKQLPGEKGNTGSYSSTAVGMVIGTPVYMSPEQVRGEKVDFRSDIFSFGSLLYEMLAGRAPFKRRSMLATISAILRETEVPIREIRRDVPGATAEAVARCLAKQPSARFATIKDAASALRGVSASGIADA